MYHYASGAGEAYGVTAEGPVHVDQAAVVAKKDEVVKMLVQGVGSALRRSKVKVVNGTAKLGRVDGKLVVFVGDETYTAENLILATGSTPAVPPIEGVKEGMADGTVMTFWSWAAESLVLRWRLIFRRLERK